jgi:hypothetical protein
MPPRLIFRHAIISPRHRYATPLIRFQISAAFDAAADIYWLSLISGFFFFRLRLRFQMAFPFDYLRHY